MDLKRQEKRGQIGKEEFSNLDEFDLGVIRRIVHGYYARNETFSLKKITKTIEGGNRFSIFHLHVRFCTEKAWLSFQETTAGIHHSRKIRFDGVARVVFEKNKGNSRKEPERQIVYTDEAWLNSGH